MQPVEYREGIGYVITATKSEHQVQFGGVVEDSRFGRLLRHPAWKRSGPILEGKRQVKKWHTHTHTTILWPSWIMSGTTWVRQHQKVKPGGMKGIQRVKNWVVGCWHGFLVMCLERGADLHMAQPLPFTISCSSKSRLVLPSWFYFSGAGSPE